MDTKEKLSILCDAAKYDVSCSTSGSARKAKSGELGNAKRAEFVTAGQLMDVVFP